MRRFLLLFCALPLCGASQVFTKIDASVTGVTQGVNDPSQTIKTQDGHIWFNSLIASRWRLYEFDGSNYNYYGMFFDSTVSAMRDISASYFAQADDGIIFTSGGQFFENGVWDKTDFGQALICQSQDQSTLYFWDDSDTLLAYSNGAFTKSYLQLSQVAGLAGPFGNISFHDAVADNMGNLFFATNDTGVIKVNVATQAVTYMPSYYQGIYLEEARTLHVASNGNLYVGGRYHFGYHDGNQWTIIVDIAPFNGGLNRIDDMAEDGQGQVWIGSYTSALGGFLGRFDESDTTQLHDIISDTTSNQQFISTRNIEAILIDGADFYFGVYQEDYLLKTNLSHFVSLEEPFKISELSAYPNPVLDKIWMADFENGSAEIISLEGKKVAELKFENGRLDLENLPTGAYFLKVLDKKQRPHQMKFIKR